MPSGLDSMNFLLVLISALLYVLSFPLWDLSFLAFFALVPLFRAVEGARSPARAMSLGGLWGALVSAGMGYWLFPTLIHHFNIWPPKASLFFLLCVAAPSALIYGGLIAVYRFVHHRHLAWYAIVLPSIWTLAEYLKEILPVFLPWGAIGYGVLPFYWFVQIADLGGVHGLTFLVVMINALVWRLWQEIGKKTRAMGMPVKHRGLISGKKSSMPLAGPAVLVVLAVIIPLIYGTIRIQMIDDERRNAINAASPAISAVIVQGNFTLHERWSGMGFYHRLKTYLEMSTENEPPTRQYNRKDADALSVPDTEDTCHRQGGRGRVIVWPETTLNAPAQLDEHLFRQIMELIGEDTLLISGGLMQDDATGASMNSAYLISGKGMLARYDKNILLPYAETSLMFDWLGSYYTAPSEFTPGRTPSFRDTPHGDVGVSICFEILYPRYIARSVAGGAGFLVNLSNDGWFGDTAMPRMHLNAARMRAIENRRFLLRAANNGISAIIGPDGRIMAETRLFYRQRIEGDFKFITIAAPYTRFGDWLIIFSVLALGTAFLRIILARPSSFGIGTAAG
jgi:apolipoprotein N-acyltransferase